MAAGQDSGFLISGQTAPPCEVEWGAIQQLHDGVWLMRSRAPMMYTARKWNVEVKGFYRLQLNQHPLVYTCIIPEETGLSSSIADCACVAMWNDSHAWEPRNEVKKASSSHTTVQYCRR